MVTHVLFEGDQGVLVNDGTVIVEGVRASDIVQAAVRIADDVGRVELCGGVSVDLAARVVQAVGGAVPVRVNRYGFESLEQVARYKEAFAGDGEPGDAAFLYATTEPTPLRSRDGVLVAGVIDDEDLRERAAEARAQGAGIIELYGGLGIRAASIVRDATGGDLPVGYID